MFRFRLERVLRQRHRQVDACSREVAEAEAALQGAARAVEEAARELQQCRRDSAAGLGGPLDARSLMRAAAWQEELVARLRSREAVMAQAQQDTEAARTRLQQAWRDREAIERLRERHHEEWRQEEARRERRELDEIGAIRAALAAGDLEDDTADRPAGTA